MKDIQRALVAACIFSGIGTLFYLVRSISWAVALQMVDHRSVVPPTWKFERVFMELGIFRDLMAATWFFIPTALLVWAFRRVGKTS
jgi:hypothetical protein